MYADDIYFSGFNAVFNFGGYFSIGAGESWSLPYLPFDQSKFYYITEGSCTIKIGDTTYHAKAGDWLLIPAHVGHSYQNDKDAPFSKYWMHFDVYPNPRIFTALGLPHCVKADKDSRAMRLFKEFAPLAHSDKFVDRLVVKSRLIELIGEYITLCGVDMKNVMSHTDKRFDKLIRYINENLDKPLSNEELAQMYFVHPNHFVRAFKSKMGQTPAKYIKNKKLEAGKRLLEGTDLSIAQGAENVGFTDPAHFSRLFHERYSMAPSVYREYYKRRPIVKRK